MQICNSDDFKQNAHEFFNFFRLFIYFEDKKNFLIKNLKNPEKGFYKN